MKECSKCHLECLDHDEICPCCDTEFEQKEPTAKA